jgi:hypothetical protein
MQQQNASSHEVLRSQPDMFAGITSILVKEVLDLREMLTFYELELCRAKLDEHRGAGPTLGANGVGFVSIQPGIGPSL